MLGSAVLGASIHTVHGQLQLMVVVVMMVHACRCRRRRTDDHLEYTACPVAGRIVCRVHNAVAAHTEEAARRLRWRRLRMHEARARVNG